MALYANPNAERHFATRIDVPDQPGLGPIRADFEVLRGIPFRGRVIDRVSGKPVMADVRYHAIYPNPNVRAAPGGELFGGFDSFSVTTRHDGSFTLPVLPGPGAMFVEVSSGGYPGTRVDSAKFFGGDVKPAESAHGDTERLFIQLGSEGQVVFDQDRFQAIVLLNPARDAGPIDREIALEPAEPVRVQLLDPDDKPLKGVRVRGLTSGRPTGELQAGAEFAVRDWNRARPRVLDFRHDAKKLVGHVELRDGVKSPLRVTLRPWAEITGRLVDAEGKPVAGVSLYSFGGATPGGKNVGSVNLGTIHTDAEGRFRIDGLTPGVEYRFAYRTLSAANRSGSLPDPVTLKPGETKDLGDVRVKPRMPNG